MMVVCVVCSARSVGASSSVWRSVLDSVGGVGVGVVLSLVGVVWLAVVCALVVVGLLVWCMGGCSAAGWPAFMEVVLGLWRSCWVLWFSR